MEDLFNRFNVLHSKETIHTYLNQKEGRIFVFMDENVAQFHTNYFSLPAHQIFIIPSGESSKSWQQVQECLQFLINHEVDKNDFILGVGGGVVTDLTGFISAIYKRGVPFALMPTSLLAMVDASIGGKNGINTPEAKNVIGTIRQPNAVLVDVDFLKTLAKKEWQNGFAEIIKHGMISSLKLLRKLQNQTLSDFMDDEDLIKALVLEAMSIKLKVVDIDPFEKGERMKLNFGHTLGHAFEVLDKIPHGNAVMKGMYWEIKYWEYFKKDEQQTELIKVFNQLAEIYYPIELSIQHEEALVSALRQDKKRNHSFVTMPSLSALGQSHLEKVKLDSLIDFIYEH